MKRYILQFFGLAVMGLFIFGCDSIVDQELGIDIPRTGVNPAKTVESTVVVTMDMCTGTTAVSSLVILFAASGIFKWLLL